MPSKTFPKYFSLYLYQAKQEIVLTISYTYTKPSNTFFKLIYFFYLYEAN